jgi:uncharacterized protein (TIGR03118 family)
MQIHRRPSRVLVALFLSGAAALATGAERARPVKAAAGDPGNNYKVTILVSNEEGEAPLQDPLLVNSWGIAASGSGPWWVSNNGTGTSTVYRGDGTKLGLQPTVPGAPTGIVFNGSTSFQMADGVPATFIFASEDGTFSAWNSTINADAQVVFSDPGSNYKGLAILGDVLYSTDFASCEVEAFQGNFFTGAATPFTEIDTAGGFEDASIPAGFCPFGIQAVGESIVVTYAKKEGDDDVAGQGNGFVRQFDSDGNLVEKIGSRGLLNSPWGVALAPPDFGKFGGCLLVGNFGDGRINAFCQNHGGKWHEAGRLSEHRHRLTIDGLWGIGFGNDGLAGPLNVLYFAAGPDDETNGYFGKVEVEGR